MSDAFSSVTYFFLMQIESFYQGFDLSLAITRAKFEEMNLDLFKKTMLPVQQVMKDAGMDHTAVNQIVLPHPRNALRLLWQETLEQGNQS